MLYPPVLSCSHGKWSIYRWGKFSIYPYFRCYLQLENAIYREFPKPRLPPCHQPLHGHGCFGQKKVADDWRSVLDPLERIVDKAVLGIPPMAITTIHQTIFNNLAFTISSCIIRIFFFATAVSFGFNAILATLLGQKGSFGVIPMFWPCIYCTSNPSSWLVPPLVASHPHFGC